MVARPKGAPGSSAPGGAPGAPPSAGRGGNATHTQQAHYAQQQGNPAFRGGNLGGGLAQQTLPPQQDDEMAPPPNKTPECAYCRFGDTGKGTKS